jgi:glycerate kinase
MKIIIAPDSYKGSLSALEVALSIKKGIARADPAIESVIVPMADGGEGTVQSMVDATNGRIINVSVNDPLSRIINSFYGILGDGSTAVIEMAAASGLPLLSVRERNPLKTSTFGTGELIKDALDKGCRKIIIGLGGSATNDGGIGMAVALGARLLDAEGKEIGHGGEALSRLHKIDITSLDNRVNDCSIVAACDVDNPLCGEKGAAAVYGPQKGATPEMIEILDKNLRKFADIVKTQLGKDILNTPGSGAAGGLGAGVQVFLSAKLERGINIVTKITNLSDKVKGSDLIITGEGMIDFQTAFGKTPFGVAMVAKQYNIPVIAIAGSLGKNYQDLYNKGFDAIFSIADKPMTLEYAMQNASVLIESVTENIIRTFIKRRTLK